MKKQILPALAIAVLTLPLAAVTPEQAQAHQGHKSHQMNSQVKVIEDVQIAVDFQTMAQHHKMMKMMKMKMKHTKGATHHFSVTLMHKKAKHVIKDAIVKIKLVGPDKKTLGSEKGTKMESMSGNGMHHFGADYNLTKKGKYNAMFMFKVKGKVRKAEFTFNLS